MGSGGRVYRCQPTLPRTDRGHLPYTDKSLQAQKDEWVKITNGLGMSGNWKGATKCFPKIHTTINQRLPIFYLSFKSDETMSSTKTLLIEFILTIYSLTTNILDLQKNQAHWFIVVDLRFSVCELPVVGYKKKDRIYSEVKTDLHE